MPRIAVIIYVDHQEVIRYPVGYIVAQLGWADEVWLFGGDATSVRLIERACAPLRAGVVVHDLAHKVTCPGDIATARTKAQGIVRENSTCEFLVMLSADTLPTPRAVDTMGALIDRGLAGGMHVTSHMLELYCDVGASAWGCTIYPRGYVNDWDEDGSFFANTAQGPNTWVPECIHLGYIGSDQVGRHLLQHSVTWQGGQERCRLYQTDKAAFTRATLLDIREKRLVVGAQPQKYISKLVFIDEPEFWNPERFVGVPDDSLTHRANAEYLAAEYMKAVDGMGLSDDLVFVKSIANEIGRNYTGT